MADNRVKPSSKLIGASGSTGYVAQKGMLDGTVFNADWLARMAMEGRMFTANAGTGTAPRTFAGAYVATTPDLDMSVPSNKLVVIVAAHVHYETFGTTLLSEVVMAYGKGGIIAPTSATDVTPVNHRLDLGNDSGVTIVSDGTGATYMTPASSVIEFYRAGHNKVVDIATANDTSSVPETDFRFSALATGIWPIMYATDGITRLNIHAASQGGTGFITITFVVPPITAAE